MAKKAQQTDPAQTPVEEVVAPEASVVETQEGQTQEQQAASRALVELIASRTGESYDDLDDDAMYQAILENAQRAQEADRLREELEQLRRAAAQQTAAPSGAATAPAVGAAPAPTANQPPEWNPLWALAKTDENGEIIDPTIRAKVQQWRDFQSSKLPTVLREWDTLDERINKALEKAINSVEGKITGNLTAQSANQQFESFLYSTPGMYVPDATGNPLIVNNQYTYTQQGYRIAQYRQKMIDEGVAVDKATKLAIEAYQLTAPQKPTPNFRSPLEAARPAPGAQPAVKTKKTPAVSIPNESPIGMSWGALINRKKAEMGVP